MSDLTADLLAAVVAASADHKEAALKVLRGESTQPPDAQPIGPLLLGMGAASKFLGVSRSTLWRILQAGTIERVELFPGSFRVRRQDLVALAAGQFGLRPRLSRRGRPRKVRVNAAVGAGRPDSGDTAAGNQA